MNAITASPNPGVANLSHHPLLPVQLPRCLGYVLGLVTAVDFCSTLSVLLAASEIQAGVGASASQFLWILTAYAGAGIATLPLIERLSRRWHYRDLMATGILLYMLGALLAAVSSHFDLLMPARILQGIGGGGLFTMSRVYLQLVVPQAERPRHLRAYILGLLGCVAPLPWLTAVLVQAYGWRACFILQAGLAALVFLLVMRYIRAERHTPRSLGALDWPMGLSFALGMMILLHGLEDLKVARFNGQQFGLLGLALLCLVYSLWRAHRHPDPLLSLKVLNGRRYLVGLGFYGLYYLINGAASYLYPRLFDQAFGLDLTQTGALQSFAGLVTVACLPIYFRFSGKITDRRRLIATGFACAALGLLWLGLTLRGGSSWVFLLGPMILKGLFPVLGVVQIAGLTYTEVPHEDFAHAYALKNIVRLIASTFSAGLVSQYWLIGITRCHEALAFCKSTLPGLVSSPGQVERQIAMMMGQYLLYGLASLSAAGLILIFLQKRLR